MQQNEKQNPEKDIKNDSRHLLIGMDGDPRLQADMDAINSKVYAMLVEQQDNKSGCQ